MATLTKEKLLEAIEDMPMDAKITMEIYNYGTYNSKGVDKVEYVKNANLIILC